MPTFSGKSSQHGTPRANKPRINAITSISCVEQVKSGVPKKSRDVLVKGVSHNCVHDVEEQHRQLPTASRCHVRRGRDCGCSFANANGSGSRIRESRWGRRERELDCTGEWSHQNSHFHMGGERANWRRLMTLLSASLNLCGKAPSSERPFSTISIWLSIRAQISTTREQRRLDP